MSVRVLRPGMFTTIQDLGRWGRQQFGVSVGGAMDTLALRLANLLVGNDPSQAALEITLAGPRLEFQADALVAICGADMSPRIDGQMVLPYRPVWVKRGSQLSFDMAASGCRAYVAFGGGIDVPVILGSRSTYVQARIGGLEGRALRAGDLLTFGKPSAIGAKLMESVRQTPAGWSAGADIGDYCTLEPIRVLHGSEFEWLTVESQRALFSNEFHITPEVDRMGYRLKGPPLKLTSSRELVSEAVSMGTIQVPPGGEPIVLMADRATTGGYPKIATAISVDLPRLAQLRPGDTIRFSCVTIEEAQQLYRKREAMLEKIRHAIALRLS